LTLEEELAESKEIKDLILQGLKDNISSGSLLGYTTNNTKVTYEGATRSYDLLKELKSRIATIEANIYRLGFIR